jgi:hypothetical protein
MLAIVLCLSTTVATLFAPATLALLVPLALVLLFRDEAKATEPLRAKKPPEEIPIASETPREGVESPGFRLYRQSEITRAIASLKANAPILITGEEGSGKTVLKQVAIRQLTDEGFAIGAVELASTKQMLLDLCEQLGIDTYNIEGKALTIDGLKAAIASFFQRETAFLVIDDAHGLPTPFRAWLKLLKRQGVPMLLLASNPPRSDVFLNLPRIELKPLPEYAIRELMEQAALERGMNLANHQLARLQERAGGNPMLAIRAIDEEYLGLDIEAGDHKRYLDITPLILLLGTGFFVMRFVALGANNPTLYVMTGAVGALFLGISRVLYGLPKESRRID